MQNFSKLLDTWSKIFPKDSNVCVISDEKVDGLVITNPDGDELGFLLFEKCGRILTVVTSNLVGDE